MMVSTDSRFSRRTGQSTDVQQMLQLREEQHVFSEVLLDFDTRRRSVHFKNVLEVLGLVLQRLLLRVPPPAKRQFEQFT